eukprot:symbB.v1.2.015364.t5/scaffold1145.1/size135521/1
MAKPKRRKKRTAAALRNEQATKKPARISEREFTQKEDVAPEELQEHLPLGCAENTLFMNPTSEMQNSFGQHSSLADVSVNPDAAKGEVSSASLAAVVPKVLIGQSQMPAMAFGVGSAWLKTDDPEATKKFKGSIHDALDAGFRHLDDAEAYGRSHLVGEVLHDWLAKTGVPREEMFITNKAITLDGDISKICDQLLKDSKLEYFDLFLLHSVVSEDNEPFKKSLPKMWEEMMALKSSGKVKEIGVSNWRIEDLESIRDAPVQPVCNQVEAHPLLQQPGLYAYCQQKKIKVISYGVQAPISRNALHEAPELLESLSRFAERHQKTIGQVLLRWAYQTERMPVTTSSNPKRMREYLATFDFELTEQEVQEINEAGRRSIQKRFTWPNCVGPGKFWSDEPLNEVESQPWQPGRSTTN